ncbi:MAG: CHAT domain-containing protein, partial [Armatimonadota bacterium]
QRQPQNTLAARDKLNREISTLTAKGQLALERLQKNNSLSLSEKNKLKKDAEISAEAYLKIGDIDSALNIWKKIADICDEKTDPQNKISALRKQAELYDLKQENEKSINTRTSAVRIALKSDNKILAADIVQDMIDAFIKLNDLNNALEAFTELAPIIEQTGKARGVARVLKARAELLASHGQHEFAIRDFMEAKLRYNSEVGDFWSAGDTALKLADSQIAINKLEDAQSTLESAINEIETRFDSDALIYTSDSDKSEIMILLYKKLAKVLVKQNKPEEAKEVVLKAKKTNSTWFTGLIRSIREDSDPDIAFIPTSIDVISSINGDTELTQISNEVKILAEGWNKYISACWRISEIYHTNYMRIPVNPLDLFKHRQGIPANSIIIEYMISPSILYIFTASKDNASVVQVPASSAEINKNIFALRQVIKICEESMRAGVRVPPVDDWNSSSLDDIRTPLEYLYNAFISPIEDKLNGKTTLIFSIPDDISSLPIHAFTKKSDSQKPEFLISKYDISYLGRGMLSDITSKDSRLIDSNSDRLIIFADPENNLPGALQESSSIREHYQNSRAFTGKNATKSAFLREFTKANVLHIAAHNSIAQNFTGFNLTFAGDGNYDGTIGIGDLTPLTNNQLKLVTLSACDSISTADPLSTGTARTAELFSLLGAQSVMGGLWKVSDESSTKIMTDFYKALARGRSRSASLQTAQLNAIKTSTYAHPFYWAGFALYGNPR